MFLRHQPKCKHLDICWSDEPDTHKTVVINMAQYQFSGWELSDFSAQDVPFTVQQSGDEQAGCSPVLLGDSAQRITIETGDTNQHKNEHDCLGAPVRLRKPVRLAGREFAAGSRIVPELVLKTDDATPITLVVGRLVAKPGDDQVRDLRLVFSSARLKPGQKFCFSRVSEIVGRTPGQNCFARGTLIETPHGALPVEQLEDGDEVLGRNGDIQLISWIGSRRLSGLELVLNPRLQPVRIMAGALTGGRPGQDLVVSQDHRLLVDDWRAPYLFGEDEILVPAKSLINQRNVIVDCPQSGVEYFHLLMDGHSLVCANGLWAETMQPDQATLQLLDADQRAAVLRIRSDHPLEYQTIMPALPHQSAASIAA